MLILHVSVSFKTLFPPKTMKVLMLVNYKIVNYLNKDDVMFYNYRFEYSIQFSGNIGLDPSRTEC